MIRMTPTHTITHLPKAPLVTKRRVIIFLTAVIITPFLIAFIGGSLMGIAKGMNEAPASKSTDAATVRDFNDGFIDSKKDDCQQGSQFACNWLKSTGH